MRNLAIITKDLSPTQNAFYLISTLNKIAKNLCRHPSTLSRELNRNTGQRGYRNKQANELAQKRHKEKPKASKLTDEVKSYIHKHLKLDWEKYSNSILLITGKKLRVHPVEVLKIFKIEPPSEEN